MINYNNINFQTKVVLFCFSETRHFCKQISFNLNIFGRNENNSREKKIMFQ